MTNWISRDELVAKLHSPEPLTLVEALGPAFYADAHLPGAINIPPDQVDRLARGTLLDRTAQVVVYCSATCSNAGIVARRLQDLGYQQVRIYIGGKEDWVEQGLPVEREA